MSSLKKQNKNPVNINLSNRFLIVVIKLSEKKERSYLPIQNGNVVKVKIL